MKCPKCGYISFDHLEECMKCSRDLSSTRGELNLLNFRPDVPFLLGSLVGDMQDGGGQQDLSITQETEIELGGFDMDESSGFEGSINMDDFEQDTEDNPSKETKLSDISLDDLENIEASALGDTNPGDLHPDDLTDLAGDQGSPAHEDEASLGLENDMDDLSAEDFGALDEDFTAEPTAASETASTDPGAGLELDLNEDDLSALAKELEDHLDSETGGMKKKSGAGEEEFELELEDD